MTARWSDAASPQLLTATIFAAALDERIRVSSGNTSADLGLPPAGLETRRPRPYS